jgi:hypothetical protein
MNTEKVRNLAEEFCKLNAGEQAAFLSEVASTFHSWGEDREYFQIEAIAHCGHLKYGKIFIDELHKLIRY